MTLVGIGIALAILACGSVVSLVVRRSDRAALAVGSGSAVGACAVGLAFSVAAVILEHHESALVPWPLPLGALHVGLDPLASFFLVCVFAV
jgi:hypothetical protein